MAKWWRIESIYSNTIKPVEVVKETPEFVTWISDWFGKSSERRSKKSGEFFPTWREAHAHMLKQAQQRVQRAADELARAQIKLEVVSNMQEPVDAVTIPTCLQGK